MYEATGFGAGGRMIFSSASFASNDIYVAWMELFSIKPADVSATLSQLIYF